MAQVIARDVFAVLEEFDGLAEIRAFVHAGQVALDDMPRPNFQPRDPLDRLRMQKSF
jgi:hypothetical protein